MNSPKQRSILNSGYLFHTTIILNACKILDFFTGLFPKKHRVFPREIKSILIIKPDHLGDMLMLTSVLPAIKMKFPGAVIDIICGKWGAPILDNNPYIDHKIFLHHLMHNRGNNRFLRKLAEFAIDYLITLQEIKRRRYDLCLIMRTEGFNLISLAWLGGCKYIIGHKVGGLGSLLDLVVEWKEGVHQVEHFLEVLRPLGIETDVRRLKYELYPTEKDFLYVAHIMGKDDLSSFVIIHPGSGDSKKALSKQICLKLIEKIGRDTKIVFTGTECEAQMFWSAAKESPVSLVNLMGLFSVQQLYIFFSRADMIFTADSLAGHIASAVGKKAIAFYSGINDDRQWKPLGENIRIIKNKLECSPCCLSCEEMSCMDFSKNEEFSKLQI